VTALACRFNHNPSVPLAIVLSLNETAHPAATMCCTPMTWGGRVEMGKANRGQGPDHPGNQSLSLGTAVRVYPGTAREVSGVIVEDFGDSAGQVVQVGGHHIVDAARRWAVRLDNGSLVFVDDNDITAG
jgi:hypothetical protein